MEEDTFIPIILFFLLLFATYYLLGTQALSSNIFMLSIYSMFVPILFFTYGAYIEKQIVKSQIERLIDNLTSNAKELDIGIPPMPHLDPNKNLDLKVKKDNDDLLKKAFITLSIGFVGGLIISMSLWKFAKQTFNFKHLVYENFSLLFLVAITELVFFGVVTKNYRTLDTNGIKKHILEQIADK